MLDNDLLTTVALVLREGSFERAARLLHVTPSAVSQRVRLLEERLGAVLVVRGSPCTATETGERLARHADTLALLEAELRRDLPGLPAEADAAPPAIRVAINADSLGTWFVGALAEYTRLDDTRVDVSIDDQDQTAQWLRRGQVMAAVTSLATPVQGCRSRKLGALRYVATASPTFVARWFADGVDARSLARAPSLVFDRNDQLQAQWVRRVCRRELALSAYRLPSTRAFVEAAEAGIGWGMNPLALVEGHLRSGRLVTLLPERPLDVPLYWQVARLPLPALERLSAVVARVGAAALSAAG